MSRQNNNSTRQSSLYSRRRQQQQRHHQNPQDYEEDDFPELPESRSPSKYIGSKYYKAPMQSPNSTHQEDLGFKKSHRPLRLGGLPAPRGKWTPCSTPRSTATSSSNENTPHLGDVRNKCGGVIRRTPTPQPEEEQPHFPPTVVRPIDFSSEESGEASSLNASRSSSVTHRSSTSTTTMTHGSLSSSAPVTVSEHTSTAPSHATTMEVSQLDSEEQYQYHHQTLPPRPEMVVAGGRRGPLASSSRSTGGTTATASSMSVTAPPTISGFKTVVEQHQVFRYDPYSLGRVYHTVELEIEVPVQEEEVLASQSMVFHPYPAAAAPSSSFSTAMNQQPPKAADPATRRPPLAPPAPRSLQMKTAAAQRVASISPSASVLPRGIPIPPALTNLQLSELAKVHSGQLCGLTTPRTARGGAKEGTPRINSARSGGESPSTSRSDKYALSHVDETPRSQRGATPRSAGSTPRDLPEKMDGPYRNLAGLGVTPRPGDLLASSVVTTPSSSSIGMTPRSDPSVVNIVSAEQQQQFREEEEEEEDGGCETGPSLPEGTLHCAALQGKVDFCRYPTKAFDICSSNPRLPKEKMERMFIGQLPYNVTEMQLGWLAYAFGGGVRLYHYERITKLDRSKKKQLPTGCFHFFVEPQHVDQLMVGLHKKILVDDTGVWVARDEAQDTVLKAYTESMKSDKTKRFQGRPYGSIVIQHSTSTFDPDAPQQPVVGDTVTATAHTTINSNTVDSRGQ